MSHGQLNLIIWLRCSATLYWALTLDQKLKDNRKFISRLEQKLYLLLRPEKLARERRRKNVNDEA